MGAHRVDHHALPADPQVASLLQHLRDKPLPRRLVDPLTRPATPTSGVWRHVPRRPTHPSPSSRAAATHYLRLSYSTAPHPTGGPSHGRLRRDPTRVLRSARSRQYFAARLGTTGSITSRARASATRVHGPIFGFVALWADRVSIAHDFTSGTSAHPDTLVMDVCAPGTCRDGNSG